MLSSTISVGYRRVAARRIMTNSQINFTVDEDAKELAKERLDHGELSNQLRQTIREIAFGEDISKRAKLQDRLDNLKDRRDELKRQKEEIESELDEITSKIERVDNRLSELETKEDAYQGALEMLEDQLMSGTHIDPNHGQVKKAAHLGEKEPDDVIQDLKERNPSVPEYAFVEYRTAQSEYGETWTGVA